MISLDDVPMIMQWEQLFGSDAAAWAVTNNGNFISLITYPSTLIYLEAELGIDLAIRKDKIEIHDGDTALVYTLGFVSQTILSKSQLDNPTHRWWLISFSKYAKPFPILGGGTFGPFTISDHWSFNMVSPDNPAKLALFVPRSLTEAAQWAAQATDNIASRPPDEQASFGWRYAISHYAARFYLQQATGLELPLQDNELAQKSGTIGLALSISAPFSRNKIFTYDELIAAGPIIWEYVIP